LVIFIGDCIGWFFVVLGHCVLMERGPFTGFYGFNVFCKEIWGFWDNFLGDLSELGSIF